MTLDVHYSSAKDDWCTPEVVLERVRRLGPIDLDPCWNHNAITRPARAYGKEQDGLAQNWDVPGRVFVNPPYGRDIGRWMTKCLETRADVVALIPARTDTRWFPWHADRIAFWKGRLTFLGAPHPAPFPSAIAYWGRDVDRFAKAFADVTHIVRPI